MYLTIIALPLLSGIINGLVGRKIGKGGSERVVKIAITISMMLGIVGYYEIIIKNTGVIIEIGKILKTENIDISLDLGIDVLSIIIYMPILIVSMCVQYYSIEYMREDPHSIRFNCIISFFTFFMLVLVSGINWIIIFIAWEGIGICSFLLINFWYKRNKANKAGIKAIIMNRIGDWGLTIGIIIISIVTGNIDILIMNSIGGEIMQEIIDLISILILLGATAKSAQLVLYTWLPGSMEGPTPVSALLHSATMVVSGVYILIRISPILEYSKSVLLIIAWLGSITTAVAGLIGVFQKDLKKIVAYSTMSQLGYMVLAIGLSEYQLSIYHLMNHAYYKGLLFISLGVIIHTINDEQDIRRLGGIIRKLPFTYITILISTLSLIGIPFLSGFFSKEMIIETSYNNYILESIISYILGILSVVFTSIYSIKIIKWALIETPGSRKVIRGEIEEPKRNMYLPLTILSVLSIVNGYLVKDTIIGTGNNIFGNSINIIPKLERSGGWNEIRIETSGTSGTLENIWEILIKNLPLILIIIVILINIIKTRIEIREIIKNKKRLKIIRIIEYISKGLEFDNIYYLIISNINKLGKIVGKRIDKGILEIITADRLIENIKGISKIIGALDKGNVRYLIINIVSGIIIIDNLYWIEILIIIIIISIRSLKNESGSSRRLVLKGNRD